jgi:hypothetical protein
VGKDSKGKISVVMYACAIALSCLNAWISLVLYGMVTAMWIIPDRRIEKKLSEEEIK